MKLALGVNRGLVFGCFLVPNMVKGLKKATGLVFEKNLTYEYCNLHECGEKGC